MKRSVVVPHAFFPILSDLFRIAADAAACVRP